MNGHSRMLPPSPFSIKHISSIPFFSIYILTLLSCVSLAQTLHLVIPMAPKFPLASRHCRWQHASLPPVYYLLHELLSLCYSGGLSLPVIFWAICGGGPTSMGARVISGYRSWRVLSAVSRNAWYVLPRLIFTLTILI